MRLLPVLLLLAAIGQSSADVECHQRLFENGQLIRGDANGTIHCADTQFCAVGVQTVTV